MSGEKGRTLKRLVAMILSVVMTLTQSPITLFADGIFSNREVTNEQIAEETNFSDEMISQMQEICGDKYNAQDVLYTMYRAGMIDKNGQLSLGDTFNVGGTQYTEEQLRQESQKHDVDEIVTIDGESGTWGEIKELFVLKDLIEMQKEAQNVNITEEHVDALSSLMNQIANEGIDVYANSELLPQNIIAPTSLEIAPMAAATTPYTQGGPSANNPSPSSGKLGEAVNNGMRIRMRYYNTDYTSTTTLQADGELGELKIPNYIFFQNDSTSSSEGLEKGMISIAKILSVNEGSNSIGYFDAAKAAPSGFPSFISGAESNAIREVSIWMEKRPTSNFTIEYEIPDQAGVLKFETEADTQISTKFFPKTSASALVTKMAGNKLYSTGSSLKGTITFAPSDFVATTGGVEAKLGCLFMGVGRAEKMSGATPVFINIKTQNSQFVQQPGVMNTSLDPWHADYKTDSSYIPEVKNTTKKYSTVQSEVKTTTDKNYFKTMLGSDFTYTAKVNPDAKSRWDKLNVQDKTARGTLNPQAVNPFATNKKPVNGAFDFLYSPYSGYNMTNSTYHYWSNPRSSALAIGSTYTDSKLPSEISKATTGIEINSISIPDGVYGSGDVIPVNVEFKKPIYIGYSSLVVNQDENGQNGTTIYPIQKDNYAYGYKATYLYFVKDIEPGTLTLNNIQSSSSKNTFASTAINKVSGYHNTNCKISSKFIAFFGALKTSMNFDTGEAVLELEIPDTKEAQQALPRARSEYAENVSLKKADGTTLSGELFYLQNMYASYDGEITKVKFYIDGQVGVGNEKSTVAVANVTLPINSRLKSGAYGSANNYFPSGYSAEEQSYYDLTDKTAQAQAWGYDTTGFLMGTRWFARKNFVNIFYSNDVETDVTGAGSYATMATEPAYSGDKVKFLSPYREAIPFEPNTINIDYSSKVWKDFELDFAGSGAYLFDIENSIEVNEENLYLDYVLPTDKNYSFTTAGEFSWKSNNTSVATIKEEIVNGQKRASIILTGAQGEATFTLTASNGGEPITVNSSKIKVLSDTSSIFFRMSKSQQQRTALSNDALDVLFSTNVATHLEDDVTQQITMKLYAANASGEPTGAALHTATLNATKDSKISHITIPANILSVVTPAGQTHNYVATVEMNYNNIDYKVTSNIRVISAPPKVRIQTQDGKFSYVKDSENLTVNWDITNFKTGATGQYTVVRNSTGATVKTGAVTGSGSFTLNANDIKVTSGTLKEAYTVTITAKNPDDEATSVASAVIFVYNSTAVEIVIKQMDGNVSTTMSGDTITMDNKGWVTGKVGSDGRTINYGSIDIAQFRRDVTLKSFISINYGNGVWGMMSDRIKWEVDPAGNNAPLTVNYKQGGAYAPVQTYVDYKSFIPDIDFYLSGIHDGTGTVTATHANAGMSDTVNVEVKDLQGEVFMFKTAPAMQAKLAYTNGDGTAVIVETDSKGELAVYEPSGIKGFVRAVSKNGGNVWMGQIEDKFLISGEKDGSAGLTYNLNTMKMFEVSNVTLNFKKPNGQPLANTDVTIRGGVYKNDYYAALSMFDWNKDNTNDNGGRIDSTVTTDASGNARFRLDASTFAVFSSAEELLPSDSLMYVFETHFGANKDAYYPEIIKINPAAPEIAQVGATRVLRAVESKFKPFIVNQYFLNGRKTYDATVLTENIGPSNECRTTHLSTHSMLWGMETRRPTAGDVFTLGLVDNYTLPADASLPVYNGADSIFGRIEDRKGEFTEGQTIPSSATVILNYEDALNPATTLYSYPFSTFAILHSDYTMTTDTLGDFLKLKDPAKPVDFVWYQDGKKLRKKAMTFNLMNTVNDEPTKSPSLVKAGNDAANQITEKLEVSNIFNNLVPGGDMLAKGLTFFTGIKSQGKSTVRMSTFPTEDPTTFKLVVSIGKNADENDQVGDVEFNYPEGKDFESFNKEMENLNKGSKETKNKKDDDDGGDVELSFRFAGAMTALATYNQKNDKWSIILTGGEIGAIAGIKYSYDQNFMVGAVPATVSFEAGAELDLNFGAQTLLMSLDPSTDFKIGIDISATVDAFAGIGFDFSIVAIKLGIFGHLGIGVDTQFLTTAFPFGAYVGNELEIEGEIGLKFVLKLIFFNFEKTFASVGFGWTKSFGDYDRIQNYWRNGGRVPMGRAAMRTFSGKTLEGANYSATLYDDGYADFVIENEGLESRDYLTQGERVWSGGASARAGRALDTTATTKNIETNSYPYSNPILTEDGKILVYISDANSTDVEETVLSYAELESGTFAQKGFLAKKDGDGKIKYGYGDTAHSVSGANNNYFATWVTQNSPIEIDQGYLTMLNASDIFVAQYNSTNSEWERTKLTDNSDVDVAPSVANAGTKAIVAWRNTIGSSIESTENNPLEFNVADYIRYTTNIGGAFATNSNTIAYNGSNGAVRAIDTAMASDGSAIIAFNAKDGENKSESAYIFVDNTGKAGAPIFLTTDDREDENIQVKAVKVNNVDKFLIAWASEDEVKLTVVGTNGLVDTNLSDIVIEQRGETKISNTFSLITKGQNPNINDVAIVWNEYKQTDAGKAYNVVKASRLYLPANGNICVSLPIEVAKTADLNVLDFYDAYIDSSNSVKLVALVSDYSSTQLGTVGTINLGDVVNAAVGQRTEANASRWDSAMAKAQEEQQAKTVAILAQKPTSKMVSATGAFIASGFNLNGVSIKEPDEIQKSNEVPVVFEIENVGYNTPITSVEVTLDGKKTTFATEIMPGGNAMLIANYTVPDSGASPNVDYSVKVGTSTKTGTMKMISYADIAMRNMRIVSETDGQREILVDVFNNSDIPLTNSGATVNLSLFAGRTGGESLGTATVSGSDLTQIDNGTYTHSFTVSLADLMTKTGISATEDGEIPNGGMLLTASADLALASIGGVDNEPYKLNNYQSVIVKGLYEKQNEETYTVLSTDITYDDVGNATIDCIVRNNSYITQDVDQLVITLLDEHGETVASGTTFDGTDASKLSFTKEEIQTKTVVIEKDAMGEGDIADIKVNLISLAVVISDVTISGEQKIAISDQDVTLTLWGGEFKDISEDQNVTSWFTNIPSGLSAKVKTVTDSEVVVTISGTPTGFKKEAIAITVPTENIEAIGVSAFGDAMPAMSNSSALFNILKTQIILNDDAQDFDYDGTEKAFVLEIEQEVDGCSVKYTQGGAEVTPIEAGEYDVTITRAEDDEHEAYEKTITGGLVIDKVDVLTFSIVPSLEEAEFGDSVTLTATISGVTQPTGEIQFFIGDTEYGSPVTISQDGKAEITWQDPEADIYSYYAEYSGDNNFNESETTKTDYSVKNATFTADEVVVVGEEVTYDKNAYSISITTSDRAADAEVTYSTDGENYESDNPEFINAGNYIVYYKITKPNFNEINAQELVIINPIVAELSFDGHSDRVYDGSASRVSAEVLNTLEDEDVYVTITNGDQVNAGRYTATASELSDSNYALPTDNTINYRIKPIEIKIEVEKNTKSTNSRDPEITYNITGDLIDDEEDVFIISRPKGEQSGNYPYVLDFTNPNYAIEYAGSYLKIGSASEREVGVKGDIIGGSSETKITLIQNGKPIAQTFGESFDFDCLSGNYNILVKEGTNSYFYEVEVRNNATFDIDLTENNKSFGLKFDGIMDKNVVVGDVVEEHFDNIESSLFVKIYQDSLPKEIKDRAGENDIFVSDFGFSYFVDGQKGTPSEVIEIKTEFPEDKQSRPISVFRLYYEGDGADDEPQPIVEKIPYGQRNKNDNGEYAEFIDGKLVVYIKDEGYVGVFYEKEVIVEPERPSGGGGGEGVIIGKPKDPETPKEPTNPVKPTDPTDPVKPTDPVNPVQPTQPTESTKPEPVITNPLDSTSQAKDESVVIVDGKEIQAGEVVVDTEKGTTTTVVDQNIIQGQIESAKDNVTIVVPKDKQTDTAKAELVVDNILSMQKDDMSLTVKVGSVVYEMPANAIDTESVLGNFGDVNAKDVPLSVEISVVQNVDSLSKIEEAIKDTNTTILSTPIEFKVTANYGGREVEITEFSQYVTRKIEIPVALIGKVSTAARLEKNGTLTQVPTKVENIGGKWFAKLNSITNSTYVLIEYNVSFTDMTGKWYEQYAKNAANKKIIAGYPDGTFGGEKLVTRAEFAKMMSTALGFKTEDTSKKYNDVDVLAWYAGAINAVSKYEIAKGIGEGKFLPQANITNQEAAQMVYTASKLLGFTGKTGELKGFTDVNDISAWAVPAVEFCVTNNLYHSENNSLSPKKPITRGEVAAMIVKLLKEAGYIN